MGEEGRERHRNRDRGGKGPRACLGRKRASGVGGACLLTMIVSKTPQGGNKIELRGLKKSPPKQLVGQLCS